MQEYTLQGEAKEKILLVNIYGIISTKPDERLLRTFPSMVEEIVSQLRLAEKDPDIKAVLFKIESPGGSSTASDILYHEIVAYKERTSAKVTAAMMGVAASGGYYVSLPADHIIAHPTTITGSVGVIFTQPRVDNLLEKIGASVDVTKSGRNKDMASPFRKSSGEEKTILRELIDSLAKRFINLVIKHRKIGKDVLADIKTGIIYLADEALRLGLVDQIGYLPDTISKKIRYQASERYPHNEVLQQRMISLQRKAYFKVKEFSSDLIADQEMNIIKGNAARQYPYNYVGQLRFMDKHLQKYEEEARVKKEQEEKEKKEKEQEEGTGKEE